MAIVLPLEPSIPSYRRGTTINGIPYWFDLRWNARDKAYDADGNALTDGAWYMSCYEIDLVPVFEGVKVVLGTYLGRRVDHPLTRQGVLVAVDTSGERRDAGLDDLGGLGSRVQVRWYSQLEIVAGARELAALGVLQPL